MLNVKEGKFNNLEVTQPRKRFRVCIRCQKPMANKNRCATCNIKFHDGLMMRIIKNFLGINPK